MAGRAWTIHILTASTANSTSHGPRSSFSRRAAIRASWVTSSPDSAGRSGAATSICSVLPSRTTVAWVLWATSESTIAPAASMRRTSGVATPLTTGAPRPRPTLMMRSSLPPCAPGERVNITPAARASTMRCTTSAMPTSRTPCAARYASARPLAIDAHTCRTASRRASGPRTPRTLSARPAMDTRAPSSHVALDRTARPHGEGPPRSRHSSRSSSSSPRGSGASRICCRASAARRYPARPVAARRSARGSQPAGSSWMACANAEAGKTTASGTSNP